MATSTAYNNIDSLVNNWNYTRTAQFNGLTGKKGKQVVTVIDAALVPSDWNGDARIVAKAVVRGTRGAEYDAYVFAHGFVSVLG